MASGAQRLCCVCMAHTVLELAPANPCTEIRAERSEGKRAKTQVPSTTVMSQISAPALRLLFLLPETIFLPGFDDHMSAESL